MGWVSTWLDPTHKIGLHAVIGYVCTAGFSTNGQVSSSDCMWDPGHRPNPAWELADRLVPVQLSGARRLSTAAVHNSGIKIMLKIERCEGMQHKHFSGSREIVLE